MDPFSGFWQSVTFCNLLSCTIFSYGCKNNLTIKFFLLLCGDNVESDMIDIGQAEQRLLNERMMRMSENYDQARKAWDAYWSLNASIDDFCDRRDHHLTAEYGSTDSVRFLCSDDSWDIDRNLLEYPMPEAIRDYFAPTKMVFKRYPSFTMRDESVDDIMVNHLLKSLEYPRFIYEPPMCGEKVPNIKILNHDWIVNLRTPNEIGKDLRTENEAYPMEAFLTGLPQALKDHWKQEQHERPAVNLDSELKDLLTAYDNTLKTLDERYESRISSLVYEMERFCVIYKERREVRVKRDNLKQKMGVGCNQCADDQDDGDDE